jgi:hypothetical protein
MRWFTRTVAELVSFRRWVDATCREFRQTRDLGVARVGVWVYAGYAERLLRSAVTLDIEPVTSCPVCGGHAQGLVLEQPDQLFPTGLLRVVRCTSCDAAFLNPRMSEAAIERLEDASEVYDLAPDEIEREIAARVPLVRSLGGYGLGYRTLLDVGCNRGFLLAAAKRLWWRPAGVELSPVAARIARERVGVPVYPNLEAVSRPRRGFDLVVAWHVLEHTTDPVRFLVELAPLVRRRGTLAIQVPSFDFIDLFRSQGRTTSVVCAVHNFCFGESSLRETIVRSGFTVRRLTNNPNDLMLTALAELA